MELEGTSENGKASVWLSGNQQPLRIKLDESLISEGQEAVESATLDALKAAYELSTTTMKARMSELTGDLNLPGFNDINDNSN